MRRCPSTWFCEAHTIPPSLRSEFHRFIHPLCAEALKMKLTLMRRNASRPRIGIGVACRFLREPRLPPPRPWADRFARMQKFPSSQESITHQDVCAASIISFWRIDSRFLLPSRRSLPHVNCYPAAELRGGGGDGEAIEYGNTPRPEGCDSSPVSGGRQSGGATADPVRVRTSNRVSSQARIARAQSTAGIAKPVPTGTTL